MLKLIKPADSNKLSMLINYINNAAAYENHIRCITVLTYDTGDHIKIDVTLITNDAKKVEVFIERMQSIIQLLTKGMSIVLGIDYTLTETLEESLEKEVDNEPAKSFANGEIIYDFDDTYLERQIDYIASHNTEYSVFFGNLVNLEPALEIARINRPLVSGKTVDISTETKDKLSFDINRRVETLTNFSEVLAVVLNTHPDNEHLVELVVLANLNSEACQKMRISFNNSMANNAKGYNVFTTFIPLEEAMQESYISDKQRLTLSRLAYGDLLFARNNSILEQIMHYRDFYYEALLMPTNPMVNFEPPLNLTRKNPTK